MPLDKTRIRALCFDVDGTLRDTDDQYVKTFARFFRLIRTLLPNHDEKAFARSVVMRLESPGNFIFGIPDRLGIDDELTAVSEFLHRRGILKEKDNTNFLMVHGIRNMLEALSSHYPMAVVTARGRRGTIAFLDAFGLTPFFHCIATAQTAKYTKPKPDPILWAAAEMGVSPNECVMIGDTTVDMISGKAAGAQTVGVLCGFGTEDELRNSGGDVILPSTSNLPDLLL